MKKLVSNWRNIVVGVCIVVDVVLLTLLAVHAVQRYKFRHMSADLNGDDIVNSSDLSVMAHQYGKHGKGLSADYNKDGVVNYIDLSKLAGQYKK
jgi:hypothetical protein